MQANSAGQARFRARGGRVRSRVRDIGSRVRYRVRSRVSRARARVRVRVRSRVRVRARIEDRSTVKSRVRVTDMARVMVKPSVRTILRFQWPLRGELVRGLHGVARMSAQNLVPLNPFNNDRLRRVRM